MKYYLIIIKNEKGLKSKWIELMKIESTHD